MLLVTCGSVSHLPPSVLRTAVSAAERSTGIAPRFGSVVTAMVTPFGPDGELDLDAAATLARHLADNGSRWAGRGRHDRGGTGAHRPRADLTVPGGHRGGHRPGHRLDGHQRHRPLRAA